MAAASKTVLLYRQIERRIKVNMAHFLSSRGINNSLASFFVLRFSSLAINLAKDSPSLAKRFSSY